jgi:light-regulated signal transduction histidine kinase (bacteriophytochrome)
MTPETSPAPDEASIQREDQIRALLNILDDFAEEKVKVAAANAALEREVGVRRRAELSLQRAARDLARSNAELEQFAYVASHDLQEPLRMIASYVQLLEQRYEGQIDAQADKYIRYVVEGTRRMHALVHGLLEYSRAGRRELRSETVSAEVAFGEAIANLDRAIAEAGAVVTRDAELPEVSADLQELVQVFQNLIGNAIKFRRAGARPVVHVSAERGEHECSFAVKDDGIGIDPKHFDRIFAIFQRVGEGVKYPGTGLGLAIAKKAVERHGGRIWVESAPGQGATFHFTLPAPRGAHEHAQ